jgi:hypothetical protein
MVRRGTVAQANPLGPLLVVVGLWCVPVTGASQQAAIQGIVGSSLTGSPLEGVEVTLEASDQRVHRTSTDRNGFYQLGNLEPGPYTLRGVYIGHAPHSRAVTLAPGERATLSFRLEPVPVELEGIVVLQERGAAVRDLGRQIVTPADLRLVPVPGGSGDLTSYLQTLPGVVTTGDRGGQLYVRGATAAENLVLIDGAPIYQPFHILGFFSVFPEDLISSADFYAGGHGARYSGRTSSVLDVRIREGDPNRHRAVVGVSPFIAEALVEGPLGNVTWVASARRSLIEETSGPLLGRTHPFTFESQLLKVTSTAQRDDRCSVLALRTADRGRLDPEEPASHVAWTNGLLGLRCVTLRPTGQLLEVNFSYTSSSSTAVTRGLSELSSSVWRVQHDTRATTMIASVPVEAGFHTHLENLTYDLKELFGNQGTSADAVFGAYGYVDAAVPMGRRIEVRPGVVLTVSPQVGFEPRLRARWEPLGRSSEVVQGALGLYRQYVVGTSDQRDVGSVFVAWMSAPDGVPLEALHAMLGWQQTLGGGLRWSLEGYHKQLKAIPVPVWRRVARFTTELGRADGEVHGADARLEYATSHFYGFIGYGYSWTRYSWRTDAGWWEQQVQTYHPPHDRRHQVNALASLDLAGFRASARWQLGSGLPYTRPVGFDEAFDYSRDLPDVHRMGTPRILVDEPYTGRLPVMHRLDVSLERGFDLALGRLLVQAGVINGYDRRNMFYYDLFSGRRVDQLPVTPYASVTLRGS